MKDIEQKGLEKVLGGVDDIDKRTRKSSQSYLGCYKGRMAINLQEAECAISDYQCQYYDECHNPDKKRN